MFGSERKKVSISMPKFSVYKIDENKVSYKSIKQLAIHLIGCHLTKALNIIQDESCKKEPFATIELPHNLFSWILQDCLARRKVDFMWFNLLQKQISPQCLEIRKYITDFEQMKYFINLILANYFNEKNTETLQLLRESYSYLDLYETLNAEYTTASEYLSEQHYYELAHYLIPTNIPKNIIQPISKQWNSKHDPYNIKQLCEFRYVWNYQVEREYQAEHACKVEERKLESKIDKITSLTTRDINCTQWTLSMYFTQIEQYRYRILKLSKLYEEEYEELTNQITYKRMAIANYAARRQLMNESLTRMKERIEDLNQRDENKRIADEKRREEEELEKARLEKEIKKKAREKLRKAKAAKKRFNYKA